MPYCPQSLSDFHRRFASEVECAAWLFAVRWPEGFRCPACGHGSAWALRGKAHTFECAGCGRQTSVTAGTVMHGSKLALTMWFQAAWLMATHKNGMSARQMREQLGLGSYKSAWLLCAKLRRAMVAPERNPLTGLVEADETSVSYRTKDDPPAGGPGRSHDGKLLIAGVVEITGNRPGRARLQPIADYSAESLNGFVAAAVAPRATVVSDGWSGYAKLKDVKHDAKVVGSAAAHVLLPWVHRLFANLKRWSLGVYHGLRRKHLQSYLDEFVFRFNRRSSPKAAFRSLLSIGAKISPITYDMLIKPDAQG
jgi:transposase-like protein